MRETAKAIPVSKPVASYAAQLVLNTHPEGGSPEAVKKYVRYGASPRAAQALISAGKIYALLDGRYNVAYEDIKSLAHDVLRHRIFLNFEALSDGVTVEEIISGLIKAPVG
jgi:MoxR-like ATPase